jgi:hypothetical protein
MNQKLTMNFKLALLGAATLLVAGPAFSQPLPNNFWPNSHFDNGINLGAPDGSGTPTGWVRNGSFRGSLNVIDEVTNVVLPDSTNAIMVNNFSGADAYGEWDLAVPIAGVANVGDTINVQYDLMWSVEGGNQMRVALGFLDASSNSISAEQYVVEGDSPGWNGGIDSTFTETNQTAVLPLGTVYVNVGIVSGGPAGTTGALVVDDLYIARAPTPELLPGNWWPNSSFEVGTNLDQTNGVPAGWNLFNSGSSYITQVTTNNYVSATHALEVVDNDPVNYGSWYSDQVSLSGHANPGDFINAQWFQLYSVTNGNMRVTFSFYDASGSTDVGDVSFQVTGNSPGWQGAVAGSGFTEVNQLIKVPANAANLLVQLVSAGSGAETGIMMIDDLSIAPPPPPPTLLAGNFWPNPNFTNGSNLSQTNGTPTGWVRNGSDPTIDQVITIDSTPTYALAVIDNETNQYGEWDANLALSSTNAVPGNLINIQYSALWSVANGAMRLSVFFFDASSNQLSEADYNVSGQSVGWSGAIAGSSFTVESNQVLVPANAARMRFSLVSGGPEAATGVFLLENLSAAVQVIPPIPSTVLAGNFFPNPTFEEGADLDNPTQGIPAGGWQRGGSSPVIDQITTNNWTSFDHSLELLDNDTNNYGQWYMSFSLSGLATNNDVVDIQWFWLYNVTNGPMRLTFTFLDTNNNNVGQTDFLTAQTNSTGTGGSSTNWQGTVGPPSTFDTQFHRIQVPSGATQLQVLPTSGGPSETTGVMLIDDLSVRLSVPNIIGVTGQPGNITLTWNSMPTRTYSVLFSSTLSTPPSTWTPLATGITGSGYSLYHLLSGYGQSRSRQWLLCHHVAVIKHPLDAILAKSK